MLFYFQNIMQMFDFTRTYKWFVFAVQFLLQSFILMIPRIRSYVAWVKETTVLSYLQYYSYVSLPGSSIPSFFYSQQFYLCLFSGVIIAGLWFYMNALFYQLDDPMDASLAFDAADAIKKKLVFKITPAYRDLKEVMQMTSQKNILNKYYENLNFELQFSSMKLVKYITSVINIAEQVATTSKIFNDNIKKQP